MPKVSINIPCFNSAKFIRETLESVLSQIFKDFEVIVVDDGSSDNTKDIVESFKDSRIKYFYKENEGLAKTRNKAISLSSGEYIAFLDHDDLWLPEKLEKQIGILERNKEIGLVFSDCYILRNGKKEKLTYFGRCAPSRGFIFEDLIFMSSNFIPMFTVVMRKEIFNAVGFFNNELVIAEDIDLFLRMAEKYKFDYLTEPLGIYRIHHNNFTALNKPVGVREIMNILDFWQCKKPALFIPNKKKLLKRRADIFAELANFYIHNLRYKEAWESFNLSLKNHRNKNVIIKKYILFLFRCRLYKIFFRLIRFRQLWNQVSLRLSISA